MAQLESHHFTYKTTCLMTGRYYLGMHSTRKLDDGYLGSGKQLWYSLQKHGKENHRIEVLRFFDSKANLIIGETELITEDVLKDPLCMNLMLGGDGGWTIQNKKNNPIRNQKHKNFLGKHHTAEAKKLISENHNSPGMLGKNHSSQAITKISESHMGSKNSQFGKIWITNGIDSIRINKDESIPEGWKRGRIVNVRFV